MRIGRISERRAFEQLARDGVRARGDTMWCRYVPDPHAVPPRLAFSIGRTVGPAVARNRLRRRLRAAVQSLAGDRCLVNGWLLLGARPPALERTFDQLAEEVAGMLATVVDGPSPEGVAE